MITKSKNTLAIGTESFDKVYSLGYQVNHEDWSPYSRVNNLREFFLNRPYEIDVERFRLVTEAYQKHETAPRKLQCAHAFENILMNVTLHIYDEDLILGEIAAPAKASPIYPEFSVNWISD
ncbi:MAG: pyruvate formate lyase family protein, partial [Fusobacteriaceae bacterium]